EPIKEALVSMRQRVRVYTPYGQLLPGMAYLVRRLLENTANESFLRASFVERMSEDQLLMNPISKGPAPGTNGRLENEASPFAAFRNEPVADFSREEARQAMRQALDKVRVEFGRIYPLVITNRPVATAQTIDSVNPSHKRETV